MAVGAEQAAADIGGADRCRVGGSAGADADDREGVAINVAVEAARHATALNHAIGGVDRERGVFVDRVGVGLRHRGVIDWIDGDIDRRGLGNTSRAGDGVGVGIRTVVIGVRCVGQRAVAIVDHRAVRALGDGSDERGALKAVVHQNTGGNRRVFVGRHCVVGNIDHRIDGDIDRRGLGNASRAGDGVGVAVRTVVVGVRCVSQCAVAIVDHCAVRALGDGGDERGAFKAVVHQHAGGNRRVFVGRHGIVGDIDHRIDGDAQRRCACVTLAIADGVSHHRHWPIEIRRGSEGVAAIGLNQQRADAGNGRGLARIERTGDAGDAEAGDGQQAAIRITVVGEQPGAGGDNERNIFRNNVAVRGRRG